MAITELHYFSPSLQKQTGATVILPELADTPGPYAVFYLLHGLSDDHTSWARRTSIERYVSKLSLIVVMPDGGRGFYTDAQQGFAYESAIVKDLVSYIDRTFRTKPVRSARCIGGLSMGGYGAVKLALKHPDLFYSANSHSGALAWGHLPHNPGPESDEWRRILGPTPTGGPDDCFALAQQIDRAMLPKLRIDCGTEDFLLDHNRTFHAHLESLKVPHEYAEYPGAHDWAYWDTHIQEALAFHRANLGI